VNPHASTEVGPGASTIWRGTHAGKVYTASLLTPDHGPALQRFFEANPTYYEIVEGGPPGPDEGTETFTQQPPAGWSWTAQHAIGFHDEAWRLVAMAHVVSDLPAPGVWHLGFFMVAGDHHGSGLSPTLFDALQAWVTAQAGARWLRLGVVAANPRALAFWRRCGFTETRQREGVQLGRLTHQLHVMVKPLTSTPGQAASGTTTPNTWLDDYRAHVPRDHPDTKL
jgi:GNAT superfamily N-acetyltransferase